MRIAVISDTHGNKWALESCIQAAGKVDAWFHLGDITRDTYALEKTGVPVFAVRGNTDFMMDEPLERIVEMGGVRFFLCHGHTYQVGNSLYRLSCKAQECNCEAAFFGHTHIPMLEERGPVVLMNPGSPTSPRGGSNRCMGIVHIHGGILDAGLLPLP